jgi:hypothetical protein
LDVGKAELTCCIRVPGPGKSGKRLQEVRTYPTMTRSLLVLADRLGELGVTRVVMEATSDYWKMPCTGTPSGSSTMKRAEGLLAELEGGPDGDHRRA